MLLALRSHPSLKKVVIFAFSGAFDAKTLNWNDYAMQDTAYVPGIVATGALISTFSSALGAVFGGSRLLQAIGRDKLFPLLHHVGKGSGRADEVCCCCCCCCCWCFYFLKP
jgi:amino acid permease